MKFSFFSLFPDPVSPFQILQLSLTQQNQKYIWQGHTYSYPCNFRVTQGGEKGEIAAKIKLFEKGH